MAGAINFISTNPTQVAFDQRVAAADAERRADDISMRQQFQFDQAQRDRAELNRSIDTIVAGQQPQPAVAPAAAPAPMMPPATPIPGAPMANPQPAPAPAPAIAPAHAPAAAAPRKLGRMDLVRGLSGVAGAAPQRMQLLQGEAQANEAAATRAADRVYELIKTDNPANLAMARQLALQSGMQIPEEFWTDSTARARLRGIVDTMHRMGIKGNQIPAYFKAYQEGTGNEQERAISAAGAIPAEDPIVRTVDTAQGVMNVTKSGKVIPAQIQGADGQPQTVMPTPRRMNFAPTGGAGGKGGAASVFEQKRAAWLAVNPGDAQGALDFASGRKQMSPEQAVRAATAAAKAKASMEASPTRQRAVYEETYNVILESLQAGGRRAPAGGAPAAKPAPGAAPAAGAKASPLPMAAGKIDAGKLQDGATYDVNGTPRVWNAQRKTFVKVQ